MPLRRLFAGASLVVLSGVAHAQVYVCMENGEKVFRSEPCPNPKGELGAYKAPPVHVIHPPALYSGVAPNRPKVAPPLPAAAAAPKVEDCDAYVKTPPGGTIGQATDRAVEERLRQRCLDRRAGISTAPKVVPSRPAAPVDLYCRPNALGGMTCSNY